MKALLAASAAFWAVGAIAVAQPAYDPGQGPAPSDYPACTQPGQDRCTPSMHGKAHGHHMAGHKAKAAAPKADGERG
jgi:hypothetical protein